jgi:hypothetical protein
MTYLVSIKQRILNDIKLLIQFEEIEHFYFTIETVKIISVSTLDQQIGFSLFSSCSINIQFVFFICKKYFIQQNL